mmetsp:Transcript_7546/g.11227  ORF Transcript_7546/g.11227 Transcript_7546/m.11227 type:complete len:183 (-) Transcript_7546:91-639(-)
MVMRFYPPDCGALYCSDESQNKRCRKKCGLFISFEKIKSKNNSVRHPRNVKTKRRLSRTIQTEMSEPISNILQRTSFRYRDELHLSLSNCTVVPKGSRPINQRPHNRTIPDIPEDGYLSYLIGLKVHHCDSVVQREGTTTKNDAKYSHFTSSSKSEQKKDFSDDSYLQKRKQCFEKWTINAS